MRLRQAVVVYRRWPYLVKDQVNIMARTAQINKEKRQRRLCESGLHGQISAKKPLLKDTNNKKRLVWAKKHE